MTGDRWRLVQDERHELLLFFQSLTADQWETPSLCPGWRMRDVAAHLLIDEPVQAGAAARILPTLVRHGFSVDRVNASWVERNRQRTTQSIVKSFEEETRKPIVLLGHLLGSGVALRALVIHHQDMRRPLHLQRAIAADRLAAALDGLLTLRGSVSIGSRQLAKGLRLQAVDLNWSHGEGPKLQGPGEALLMALAGRESALADLDGEGMEILRARMLARTP